MATTPPARAGANGADGAAGAGMQALHRARTLARLRRAGLSDRALYALLPGWGGLLEDLEARSDLPIGLTVADWR